MTERLHQIRGRLDVASDLVDKAVVALLLAGSNQCVLDALFDAMSALGVATASIDDEMVRVQSGSRARAPSSGASDSAGRLRASRAAV